MALLFPLASSLIVFVAYAAINTRQDVVLSEVARHRDVVELLHRAELSFFEARGALVDAARSTRADPARFTALADRAEHQFRRLAELLAKDPDQAALAQRFTALMSADLFRWRRALASAPRAAADAVEDDAAAIGADSETFERRELRALRAASTAADRLGLALNWILLAGMLVAIAALALSFWYIVRRSIARLYAISEKARALAVGEPIGDPLPGNDEIAAFDRSFHEMAQQIRERQVLLSRYRLLSDHMQDIILFFTREDRRIFEANAAASKAYGYTPEELKALRLDDLRLGPRKHLPAPPMSEYPTSFETLHVRKNGETLPVWIRAHAAVVNGQEIVFSALSDLSERKAQERELREARDQAIAAAELKSRFIATMSHEIRTPMNAIVGLSEMLLAEGLPEQYEDQVRLLNTAAQSLLGLVNDLLDLSKMEAGQMEFHSEPFNLRAVLEATLSTVQTQAERKGLALRLAVADGVPQHVSGDALRLRQVALNLLSNAVKFTEHGSVELRVARLPDRDGACRLRFEVRDTGIGLTAEQQMRIFEPFVQADASWTRRAQGTGLGLWLCSYLVEKLGGEIGLESAPGKGSTFWFTVTMKPADSGAIPESEAILAAEPAEPEREDRRILVAEDNEINQRVAGLQLRKLGFEPVIVGDGLAAVEAATSAAYALVLMDCQMPELDGMEAAKRIRAHEQRAGGRLPIVAMTANAIEDRTTYIAAGFDDILPKPVTLAALRAILDRWAAQAQAPAGSEPLVRDEPAGAFDLAHLRELADGDETWMYTFLANAQEDLKEVAARLAGAVSARELHAAKRIAHELKGAASGAGAAGLSRAAATLEALAAETPAAELDAVMREVASALEDVERFVGSLRARVG